jgi:pimeloyl-ACP methyl ester carboxylesterase
MLHEMLKANGILPQHMQDARRPPLLFVHGSFHAAWCWQVSPSSILTDSLPPSQFIMLAVCCMQEHFMPFFAAAGYDCYAVSLRGQGRSQRVAGMQAGSPTQHVTDLGHVVASLPRPPVLIGHSFGGLVVQR